MEKKLQRSDPVSVLEHGSSGYRAAVELRNALLRRPLGLELLADELAGEGVFRHFGLYSGDCLLACLMVVPQEPGTAQIRQMAVRPESQGRGHGRRLMEGVEAVLRDGGIRSLWLNARVPAVGFYGKLGYRVVGAAFTQVGIPHRRMEKELRRERPAGS